MNNYNFQYLDDGTILPKTNYNSPFYTSVPLHSQPTEVLGRRFELWRQILKSLINYYKSIAIANQQYSKINDNLIQTINFPFFTNIHPRVSGNNDSNNKIYEPNVDDLKKQTYFARFGNGSIQDIQILLKKYHVNLGEQQKTIALQLMNGLVPRLEELAKDLLNKIREIKSLQSDFKNNLNQEIAITGQCLGDYIDCIKNLQNGNESVIGHTGKKDPYLLRLKLEIQLKQQLYQENYLEEAFINLQITGLELEKIVFGEIQESLNRYNELISQEIFVMYNDLINELHEGIISKKPFFEWDDFIMKDSTAEHKRHFLTVKHDDKLPTPRKISNIRYPYNKDLISKSIRSGFFLKKSKLLKNYSKSFFILTLNYLHEFKNDNLLENFHPINSIKLNDCILTESNDMKFQLHIKNYGADNKLIKTHNFVFKRIPSEMHDADFRKWIIDLKNLTSFNSFHERFKFINGKLSNSNSRSNTPMIEITNPMENLDRVNEKLQNLQITSISQGEDVLKPAALSNTTPPKSNNSSNGSVTPTEVLIHGDHDHKDFAQNIKQMPLQLNSSTLNLRRNNKNKPKVSKLSLDNVPTVEVQQPTPIHLEERYGNTSTDELFKQATNTNINTNTTTNTLNKGHSRSTSQLSNAGVAVPSKSPIPSPQPTSPLQNSFSFSNIPEQFPGYTPSISSSTGSSSITPAIGQPVELEKKKSHIDLHGSLYRKKKNLTSQTTAASQATDDEELNKVLDALKGEV